MCCIEIWNQFLLAFVLRIGRQAFSTCALHARMSTRNWVILQLWSFKFGVTKLGRFLQLQRNFDIFWNGLMPSRQKLGLFLVFLPNFFAWMAYNTIELAYFQMHFSLKTANSLFFKRIKFFLWTWSFFAKNLHNSNFASTTLKIHNRYCNSARPMTGFSLLRRHVAHFLRIS